jgi:Protein of unknown function (DUF1203)
MASTGNGLPIMLSITETYGAIMSFRILGVSPEQFRPLFDLSDEALRQLGAVRVIADNPRMPCRVSMEHAELGEEVLLVNYEHQSANTPYRATHAIYVRKVAGKAYDAIDTVPEILRSRLLSVRAFDASDMMVDADVFQGVHAADQFEKLLANSNVMYLQVHNAMRGCYAARVERN